MSVIFTIEEIIYIIKIIDEQKNEEDYKFKKDIQDRFNKIDFKRYVEIIESFEKASKYFEKSYELNGLNNLHLEIKEYAEKNLAKYIK